MFSLFEDQLIGDVFSRAEQSRVSYNLQTEEFRNLNADLQTYLGDIKTIDDNNHQLQENIEEIRTKYISTLENHLKLLPNDFRQQSQILTDAHLTRYKFKSRTRRLISERDELKRRIHFVAKNEKDQLKHLNLLQKQERSIRNEFMKLNEQLQRLLKYVENEKQIHQQSMDKVDDLQIQLEQSFIERSKTEFEIQTLKEEVKLMQTTKEFLDEECQTIISTQTEANEYLLSRLNDSITSIREDFNQLNQTQLQQIENEYKQTFQLLEENFLTNQTTNTSQYPIEQLQDEYQSALQELTVVNNHNQTLSEQVLAMEADLYSLRNERLQQLILKDNELEYSKIELQTLNEKLNHLAEYDRNLKFELTLYRGVLESEYRRKQSSTNIPHLIRPTTLRTNNNLMTDTTTWLTSNTNQSKLNNQQQEEVLTTRNRVQSDYDLLGEGTNVQINDVLSTKTPSYEEKLTIGDSLWQQLIEPLDQEAQQDEISTNIILQDTEKPSSSLLTAVSTEDQSTLPFEAQQSSSSRTSSISTGIRKSPTSSTSSIPREDQSASSQVRQLPTTPPALRSLPTIPPSNQTTSPTNTTPFAFEVLQSYSRFPQDYPTLYEVQRASSRTSSVSAETLSDIQRSPLPTTTATVPEYQSLTSDIRQLPPTPPEEHQPSSHTSSISAEKSSEVQKSPLSVTTPIFPEYQPTTSDIRQPPSTPLQEHQPSSHTSSISAETSSEIQISPLSATTATVPEYQPPTSDIRQSPSILPQEHQPSSHTSSISAEPSSEIQISPSSSSAPTIQGDQLPSSQVHQSPSISPEEHQPSSRTSSISSKTSLDFQKFPPTATTATVPEYQLAASDIRQVTSTPPQEHQPSSRTSSISTKPSFGIEKSPLSATTPIFPEYQPSTSDIRQSPSTPPEEHQPSSHTSSISAETSSEVQKSPLSATTPIFSEYQPSTSDIRQSPSTSLQEHQPSSHTSSISAETSSEIQNASSSSSAPTIRGDQLTFSQVHQSPSTFPEEHQPSSRTSSISSKTSLDFQRFPPTATTATILEYQPPTSDVRQLPSTPPQEHQPSSRTSSISSKTSLDFERSPSTATTPIVPQYHSSTSDVFHSPSTSPEDRQTLSEVQKSPTANADVQGQNSLITADDYQTIPSADEFDSGNQLSKSFGETDDNFQYEESVLYTTDENVTSEVDRINERRESNHSTGPSSIEEFEISFHSKSPESRSSSFALTSTPREESKQNLLQSDTNISSNNENKSELKQDEISNQIHRENDITSSLINPIEENNSIQNISSAITSDHDLDELNSLLPQDTNKQLSHNTSLNDIEEVDLSTSQKLEIKSDEDDDPNLAIIMQELRYVFHELANDEDLVEIDNDLSDKIFDRLGFRDHFILTLSDSLIRKYLIQEAIQSNRPETLDWVEFRDILFPIITGRYIERHIRKLFDLFDTSRDGYLSLQKISELLEVLHANDTIDLAQNIIDKFDTDHDGKLNVDELIEAINSTADINEHALSEETENKQWFYQSPTENQTITLEVPIINFSSKTDGKFTEGISLLGRIFKRVGANSDTKQLDSNNENLSMQITNEFINNNINISSDDLELFIQLFLDKKQDTDSFINWIEFRDIFFPIINNGFYTKNHIKIWFDIFDTNQYEMLTEEQIIQLLRLLQIQNFEEIINKLNEITDSTDSWTFDELIFALDSVEETASHLLINNEQIAAFDIDWLSNNIF